jgi:hypothetical protein
MGEGAQKPHITFGDTAPIFKPKVPDVAQQVYSGCVGGYFLQPGEKIPLTGPTCCFRGDAQMEIANEKEFFSGGLVLSLIHI